MVSAHTVVRDIKISLYPLRRCRAVFLSQIRPHLRGCFPVNSHVSTESGIHRSRHRSAMDLESVEAGFFRVLLLLTLLRGIIYAILNPPFASPDELDHFTFIAHLATSGASGEAGGERLQPVLYYVLMAPAYLATVGHSPAIQLLAVRLTSLILLLGMVYVARLTTRMIAPTCPAVSIAVTSLIALSPENTVIAASANNDTGANLMGAVLAYLIARLILHPGRWTAFAMIPAVSTAFMTKGNIFPVIAVSMLILAAYIFREMQRLSRWQLTALLVAASLMLIAPLQTEGVRYAIARAAQVLGNSQQWQHSLSRVVAAGRWPWLYQYETFWATFLGDTAQPAIGWYIAIGLIIALALTGGARGIVHWLRSPQRQLGRLGFLYTVFVFSVFLQWLTSATYLVLLNAYNIGNVWERSEWSVQGRYLLPALLPFSMLLVAGLQQLHPSKVGQFALLLVPIVMLVFDMNALLSLATHYSWVPQDRW
jgi:hypothetical protein